jgi:hypothetical protein
MSRFSWQPPTRLELGETPSRPRTAPDLLRDLGVQNASLSVQRQAINGWLLGHSVDDLLRVSLRKKGLPASPLDVSAPSATHVHIIDGTATLSVDTWNENALVVFPRAPTQVPRTFQPTSILKYVLATIREPTPDAPQPERRRDGTPVA